MASRISVLALAAGLGLAGGVVILETLGTASSGPSGRVRPVAAPVSGPPPFTKPVGAGAPDPLPDGDPEPLRHPFATSELPCPEPPERSVRIAGRVEDDLGRPVTGAWVYGPSRKTGRRRGGYDCWGPVWSATSDEEGRFLVEVPVSRFEGNRGLPATAKARGLLPSRDAGFPIMLYEPVEAADMGGLVIVLRRPAVIEGMVRDGEGHPIPGAEVLFGEKPRPGGTYLSRGSSRRADRSGKVHYELDAEDDSAVDFHAIAYGVEGPSVRLHGGFVGGERVRVDVPVPARGEDRFSGRGPWVLAGRVVDGAGRPAGGWGRARRLTREERRRGGMDGEERA